MYSELIYSVKTESHEMLDIVKELWSGDVIDESSNGLASPITAILRANSFECFGDTVYDAMEETIKTIHRAEKIGKQVNFVVAGSIIDDCEVIIFMIECIDNEATIKASLADSYENEDRYYRFEEADSDDIVRLLKRNKKRTFNQAIKDDIPLGENLEISYEEWYNNIVNNIEE